MLDEKFLGFVAQKTREQNERQIEKLKALKNNELTKLVVVLRSGEIDKDTMKKFGLIEPTESFSSFTLSAAQEILDERNKKK